MQTIRPKSKSESVALVLSWPQWSSWLCSRVTNGGWAEQARECLRQRLLRLMRDILGGSLEELASQIRPCRFSPSRHCRLSYDAVHAKLCNERARIRTLS